MHVGITWHPRSIFQILFFLSWPTSSAHVADHHLRTARCTHGVVQQSSFHPISHRHRHFQGTPPIRGQPIASTDAAARWQKALRNYTNKVGASQNQTLCGVRLPHIDGPARLDAEPGPGVSIQGLDLLNRCKSFNFGDVSLKTGGDTQSLQSGAEPYPVKGSQRYGSSLHSQAFTLLN